MITDWVYVEDRSTRWYSVVRSFQPNAQPLFSSFKQATNLAKRVLSFSINPNVLVVVSKGMLTVKRCSSNLSSSTGGSA